MLRLAIVLTLTLLAAVPAFAVPSAAAVPDSTDQLSDPPEDDAYSPRRKANGEFIIGWMTSNAIIDRGSLDPLVVPRSFLQIGYGGAIPLTDLGPVTTLWLKLSGLVGVSISDDNGTPDLQGDLSLPIHAVFSYGGLRRKSVAWGGSAGLGINVARRFEYDEFTFAPSAMFEVLYAPRAIYGLRAMVDLLPASIGEGLSYHTWTVQFFVGI